jgi:predicted Zn-dependent peptidase
MALVAVGDFDPNQVQALFEKYFNAIEVSPSRKKKPATSSQITPRL